MADTEMKIQRLIVARDVDGLLMALRGKGSQMRKEAAFGLVELDDRQAVAPLINALQADNTDVRRWSAWALGRLGDDEAIDPLIEAMGDNNWRVRRNVVNALESLRDPGTVKPLIGALHDLDEGVRMLAATALGRLADQRAVKPLIEAARDREPEVRTAAIEALERLGVTSHEEAGPEHEDTPGISGPHERTEANRVAGRDPGPGREMKVHDDIEEGVENDVIQEGELLDDAQAKSKGYQGAREDLEQSQLPSLQHLLEALNHLEPEVREKAAIDLGQTGEEAAIEPLIAALGDRVQSVSDAATRALMVMGEEVVEPLLSVLEMSNNRVVRLQAVKALEVAGWHMTIAGDVDPGITKRRQGLIRQIEDELVDAIRDEYQDVRKEAAEALRKLRSNR